MPVAAEIALIVVGVLVVAGVVLRIRKLRRDEIRELSRPVERRLMSPPPSPYAPSKGFRLLDGPIDPSQRPDPPRPRLETDREYVFSESQMPGDLDVVPTPLRHNEKWALSKSARRPTSVVGLRVGIIVVVLVILVGAFGLYLNRHPKHGPTTTTTVTTTTTPRTTTTVANTSSYVVTRSRDRNATTRAPIDTHRIVVTT